MEPVGSSNAPTSSINRIYQNARWGTRMQNRSVPMEPDRDERMPWSGHPAKTSESEGWAFNVARFYDHFLHNYRLHQGEDGSLQEILPPYWTFNTKDIIWPSVVTIIPDWYYNFYGDDRPLGDNYEMMKRCVLFHEKTNLEARRDPRLLHLWRLGRRHVDRAGQAGQAERPRGLDGNRLFLSTIAGSSSGRPGCWAKRTTQPISTTWPIGSKRLSTADSSIPIPNTYESETQCSYVLPLAFGLVPEEHRPAVIDNLVDEILVEHQGHTSVGLIGMQW